VSDCLARAPSPGSGIPPSGSACVSAEGRPDMLDVLYIGLVLGFLALSWGLVELCDRL
jgi:hypothetical protein